MKSGRNAEGWIVFVLRRETGLKPLNDFRLKAVLWQKINWLCS